MLHHTPCDLWSSSPNINFLPLTRLHLKNWKAKKRGNFITFSDGVKTTVTDSLVKALLAHVLYALHNPWLTWTLTNLLADRFHWLNSRKIWKRMNSFIVCNSQSVPVKVLVFVVQLGGATVVGFVKSVVYISGTNTYYVDRKNVRSDRATDMYSSRYNVWEKVERRFWQTIKPWTPVRTLNLSHRSTVDNNILIYGWTVEYY